MYILKMLQLAILVIYASFEDVREKKIPNEIFYIGIISALLYDFVLYPVPYRMIIIKTLCIIGLFFFGMLRLMGLGDIKLWMVITAFLGILKSSAIICAACIVLIVSEVIINKETHKLVFLSVYQLVSRQKIKIVDQKSYAFAPYIAIPTIVYCLYEIMWGV